MFRNICK